MSVFLDFFMLVPPITKVYSFFKFQYMYSILTMTDFVCVSNKNSLRKYVLFTKVEDIKVVAFFFHESMAF